MNTKILLPVLIAILVTTGALIVGGRVSVERQDYRRSDGAWQVADWNSRPGCVIWFASDGVAGHGSTEPRSPDTPDFHQRGCVDFH